MKIDCDTCAVRGDACTDCVVMFLTIPAVDSTRGEAGPPTAVELDAAQARAIGVFASTGMVAPLRHLAS